MSAPVPPSRTLKPRNSEACDRLITLTGADPGGVDAMSPKSRFLVISIFGLTPAAALVIKQEALSKGAEAAIPAYALKLQGPCNMLLMGTEAQLKKIAESLSFQPFKDMKRVIDSIRAQIDNYHSPSPWRAGNRIFSRYERTGIMGILNVTPDSFSDGGLFSDTSAAVAHGKRLISEGADIIDIGGESSRPGAKPVSEDEELNRVLPVIKELVAVIDRLYSDNPESSEKVQISIDTRKPSIAEAAVRAGATIINDISGCRDQRMIDIAASSGASLIIMHMQGTPDTMQHCPEYTNIIDDISAYLHEAASRAVTTGVSPDKIAIDPGIGFGKTLEHNLEIIDRLDEFASSGFPVLLGASRKSFIGSILDSTDATDRLEGSLAAAVTAILRGASILRVHDALPTVRAARVAEAIGRGQGGPVSSPLFSKEIWGGD